MIDLAICKQLKEAHNEAGFLEKTRALSAKAAAKGMRGALDQAITESVIELAETIYLYEATIATLADMLIEERASKRDVAFSNN